jgi:acyl transferase domain-containing protein
MDRDSIAIIGLGCRYPGANTVREFWNHLLQGVDAVQPPPIDRLHHLMPDIPGGFVSNPDAFDAEFFGITPQEAVLMDPQQRLLLETTWSALEDAGYDPSSLNGTDSSVFVGVGGCDYERIVSGIRRSRFAPI